MIFENVWSKEQPSITEAIKTLYKNKHNIRMDNQISVGLKQGFEFCSLLFSLVLDDVKKVWKMKYRSLIEEKLQQNLEIYQ